MPPPVASSRPAFTLIELILVLVIMATLVAVASPALSRLNRKSQLDRAARSLVALHHQAHQRAIQEGQAYRVVIEPDQHLAWIEVQSVNGYRPTGEAAGRKISLNKTITLSFEQATASDGRFALVCNANGVVESNPITLTGPDGREVLVYCPSASEGMIIGKPGDEEAPTWGTDLDA